MNWRVIKCAQPKLTHYQCGQLHFGLNKRQPSRTTIPTINKKKKIRIQFIFFIILKCLYEQEVICKSTQDCHIYFEYLPFYYTFVAICTLQTVFFSFLVVWRLFLHFHIRCLGCFRLQRACFLWHWRWCWPMVHCCTFAVRVWCAAEQ